jgi:2-oxoglutarate ferredoxin oxidoreductase subunit gamma
MSAIEIQIAGFGGQGVVLAGMTIGRGLALYEDYHVSLTQSFGPEARGSACSVQLMVSPEPVLYPYLINPHILVTMSQEAYRKFAPRLRPGGTLIIEEGLVRPDEIFRAPCSGGETRVQIHRVPAMRLAQELGRKMVLNMVLVGFFTAVTSLLSPEAARKAVAESVPKGTEALNLAAFEKGFSFGLTQAESPVGSLQATSGANHGTCGWAHRRES